MLRGALLDRELDVDNCLLLPALHRKTPSPPFIIRHYHVQWKYSLADTSGGLKCCTLC